MSKNTKQNLINVNSHMTEFFAGLRPDATVDQVRAAWSVSSNQSLLKKNLVKKPVLPVTKKVHTGYIIFCNQNRSRIKESNSSLMATDITSRLATEWNELPDEERARYNGMSAKLKEDLERESVAKVEVVEVVVPVVVPVVEPVEPAPTKKPRGKKKTEEKA